MLTSQNYITTAFLALVNIGVLSVPLLVLPRQPNAFVLGAFFIGATLLCLADLSRWRYTDADDTETTEHRPICFAVGATIVACWWLGIATSHDISTTVLHRMIPMVGFVCMLLGAELRRRAIRTLSVDFVSDVSPTPTCELRTSGLYAYMRHPSETGLLLCVLGGAITLGSWPSLLLGVIVLIPLSVIRAQMEEANLFNRFGQAYDDYANRTGRFLPRPTFSLRTRSLRP